MITLKLSHDHSHNLPCHPTRQYLEQQQACINETDREQCSDDESNQTKNSHQKGRKITENSDYKTIQSHTLRDPEFLKANSIKKVIDKPISRLTPQQIYEADVFQQDFQVSAKILPINIQALIMQKQKLVEDKVYIGLVDKKSELLERVYQDYQPESHLKDMVKENLQQMMNQIQSELYSDILTNHSLKIRKFNINKSKNSLSLNSRSRSMKRGNTFNTYMSNSNTIFGTKSFISQVHPNSYPEKSSRHSTEQVQQAKDFSLQSQRTKKAEEFIKKIQLDQDSIRQKRKEKELKKKEIEVRSMQEKKQFQEQIKNERKNYLKRRIEAKRQIKEKQLQIRQKMNKQYKEFLQKYKNKVPLFKQKETQFNLISQQQLHKKQQVILNKRKQEMKSIGLQQIRNHEKQYLLKKQQIQKQKANQKSISNQFESISKKKKRNQSNSKSIGGLNQNNQNQSQEKKSRSPKYYKSKLYETIIHKQEDQKINKEEAKLNILDLLKKRRAYSLSVRQNYVPKTDAARQKQLQQLIKKLQWTEQLKNGRMQQKQRNQKGNRYLARIHELIAELRAKGKIDQNSKSINFEQQIQNTNHKPIYKNYLEQLRTSKSQSKSKRNAGEKRYSVDLQKDFDLEGYENRAKKFEQNAKRREAYIGGRTLQIARILQEGKKADEDYLQSIKTKFAIINSLS